MLLIAGWSRDSFKNEHCLQKYTNSRETQKNYKVQTNANEELMTLRENISYSIERSF